MTMMYTYWEETTSRDDDAEFKSEITHYRPLRWVRANAQAANPRMDAELLVIIASLLAAIGLVVMQTWVIRKIASTATALSVSQAGGGPMTHLNLFGQ